MNKGVLLVVSGPSGTGKGTVMKAFFENEPNVFFSVSATTREKRPGETDGVEYHFMDKDAFLRLKKENGFLENACFCGNYYGTPRKEVMEKLEHGIDVVLEIEVQGAMQVHTSYPEAVLIFIVPPSMEELRRRLEGRQTESRDVVEARLEAAQKEIAYTEKYDYVVVNREPAEAAAQISAIAAAEKLRIKRQIEFVKENLL